MNRLFSSKCFTYSRKASHAGSWYTDDGDELSQELDSWLEQVQVTPPISTGTANGPGESSVPFVRAVIAPHAGYSYSGSTAAHAYAHLNPINTKRIFVLGPSHHVYMNGCAISVAAQLETPLGDLHIDRKVTEELLRSGKFQPMSQDIDEDEHSIEMHLPYIKRRMGVRPCTVVAIMVGSTSEEADEEYGTLLAPYLADPTSFFIISSDFCHWGARFRYQPHDAARGEVHEYIRWLDHAGMALLESQDLEGFYDYLREHSNTICGRHPICTFLHAVRKMDNGRKLSPWSVLFVHYAQSSACMNKRDSSVSYASAVISC